MAPESHPSGEARHSWRERRQRDVDKPAFGESPTICPSCAPYDATRWLAAAHSENAPRRAIFGATSGCAACYWEESWRARRRAPSRCGALVDP